MIRFMFNQQQGGKAVARVGGTRGVENFSRVLVQQVAFTFADHLWEKLKTEVQSRIERDIQIELNWTAHLFMQHVIGISGRNLGPTGEFSAKAPRAAAFTGRLDEEGIRMQPWARRSRKYLDWRASKGEGDPAPWFRRHHPSILDSLRSASTWTSAFGGINVIFTRTTSFGPSDSAAAQFNTRLKGTRGGNVRVGVGTVRVEAMKRLTTAMLPALGGASLDDVGSNPQSSGLLSKLGPDIANRLGGNPARVPFRATIQPFLGFFLTRQLPNAVLKRVEQGMKGALIDQKDVVFGARAGKRSAETTYTARDYNPKR